jgi:hypothetical protein
MRMEIYQRAHRNLSACAWKFIGMRMEFSRHPDGLKFPSGRREISVWAEENFRIGGNFTAYRRK